MSPNSQFPADLVTFTEEILHRRFHIFAVESVMSRRFRRRGLTQAFWCGLQTLSKHIIIKK